MSEAVTTTGSIDAKLTIDKSDWDRKVAEAKAEAHELGALHPEVKIDANVGPAIQKMAELEAVERQLEATNIRVAAAEKALDKEQVNSTSSALRLATVEKILGDARKTEITDTGKATAAEQQHSAARDKSTESTKKNTQAQQQNGSALGVLIALSPALLGATTAIAASAVGLGAAFTGMAAGGVAAIMGIKQEMADGTTVGNEYAAGLANLKTDFSELSTNSANAMLGSFNTIVADINVSMPFLNQMLSEGAAELGHIGGTALQGVLSGLQQMNPLIQAGSVELGKFVTWLFSFTGTNGFSQFIQYAMDNLPATMHLIENLVTLAGHILAAFAPLGPVVLGFLNGLTDVLNALPLPVLAGLVATAATIPAAFGIAKTAVSVFGETAALSALQVEIFGTAVNLAVPVVGILTAILAGVGMAFAASAAGAAQGTSAVQDYTQALKDDSNAIGEHVRAQAAQALVNSGAAAAARTLGVNLSDVTDAATGNADAMARVTAITDAATKASEGNSASYRTGTRATTEASKQQGDAAKVLTDIINGTNGAINTTIQNGKDYAAMTDKTTGALTYQQIVLQQQAALYGESVPTLQAAVTAQEGVAAQAAQATANMIQENDAAGLLKQSFDALNGKSLSLEQAQTAAAAAANTATKSFQTNGLAIDGNTDAAVANQQALQGKVAADQAAAEATAKSTGSTAEGTKAYAGYKAALEDQLRAHGELTPAVQAYLDKLYDVNDFKPKPTKLEVDKAQAELDLATFQAHADALRGKTIDIITRNSTVDANGASAASSVGTAAKGQSSAYAHGGTVSYLASGGHPGGPRGSDTVPAWLTPKEFVVKRASAESIGLSNLNYMNATGQLPPQGQAVNVSVTVQNPFTGEEVQAVVKSVAVSAASAAISAANQDAARRPSR